LPVGFCARRAGLGAWFLGPFQSVRIFDGKSAALSASSDVLITGNIIERISRSPLTVDAKANVRVISGDGGVLMPDLLPIRKRTS
jgi:hypothetical protein